MNHPTVPATNVSKVHYADAFLGYLYAAVEYTDGVVKHHYLDDPGAWAAATAYTVGTFRRPTNANVNGFRYEVTAIAGTGTSGGAEPAWPTTPGSTVIDNAGPNQITWTCRTFEVTDANCPHGKGVTKIASKIFSTKGTSPYDTVRYSKTSDPRNWTAASDAGFIAVGLQQEGAQDAYALGQFQNQLIVYFNDSAQVWNVDPNPALISLKDKIFGVGTRYPRGAASFATDNFFLADVGVRSITVNQVTDNLQDTDVGSPIDDLIAPVLKAGGFEPVAIYLSAQGQFWLVIDRTAWVYSYSRSAKISAWCKYTFPFAIDDVTQLNNVTYLRSGDDVYKLDDAVYTDDGTTISVEIEMPYLDAKQPGILKQFIGVDAVLAGNPLLVVKTNVNRSDEGTDPIPMSGDTRPGNMTPAEFCAVSIAPTILHAANEDFRLDLLAFFFESLGPI